MEALIFDFLCDLAARANDRVDAFGLAIAHNLSSDSQGRLNAVMIRAYAAEKARATFFEAKLGETLAMLGQGQRRERKPAA